MSNLKEQIQGSWELQSFEIEDKNQKKAAWGKNAKGLLIYAPTGHMSVSINREVDATTANKFEGIFNSILFYSGTYSVDGEVINHQVTNASNPERIGKKMIRYAKLNGDSVTLTTPEESFGRAILVWRKLSC